MKYRIISISEEDYGCEGIPDGEELMCSVLVQDESGAEKLLRISDRYLTENELDAGSIMEVKNGGSSMYE